MFLDNNNKLYAIDSTGPDSSILTHEKLNNVTDVYSSCETDGCSAYAKTIIDGNEQTIDLFTLFGDNN